MLLDDNVNDTLMTFDMNFTGKREDILKKLAKDERIINYNNYFFKTDDLSIKILIF